MDNDKVAASLAKLEEQGRWFAQEITDIKTDNKEIKGDVKVLLAWKWRAIGAGATLGFIGGLLVEFWKR